MSWSSVALVVSMLFVAACGDDDGETEPEGEPVFEPETEPEAEPEAEPEPLPEREPAREPERVREPAANVEPPVLDSVDAINSALRGAQGSPQAVWALTDPARGLDLDFNWMMGHFSHTACSEGEVTTWLDWASADGLSFYRLDPGEEVHCVDDLSLCAACPEDIAACDQGYVFEFAVDGDGRRVLYGVIAAPARSEALWDLTATTLDAVRQARADLGALSETGVKCGIRARLLAGEVASLWVEHVPLTGARSAEHLEGEDAATFARDLGALFNLSAHCDTARCALSGEREVFGVHYVRPRRRRSPAVPRITVVTHGPAECDGCTPEPSPELLARASRRRRR